MKAVTVRISRETVKYNSHFIFLSSLSRTLSKNDNCIDIFRIENMFWINPKKIYRSNDNSHLSVPAGVK